MSRSTGSITSSSGYSPVTVWMKMLSGRRSESSSIERRNFSPGRILPRAMPLMSAMMHSTSVTWCSRSQLWKSGVVGLSGMGCPVCPCCAAKVAASPAERNDGEQVAAAAGSPPREQRDMCRRQLLPIARHPNCDAAIRATVRCDLPPDGRLPCRAGSRRCRRRRAVAPEPDLTELLLDTVPRAMVVIRDVGAPIRPWRSDHAAFPGRDPAARTSRAPPASSPS